MIMIEVILTQGGSASCAFSGDTHARHPEGADVRDLRDVMFEDVVFDNGSFVTVCCGKLCY